MSSPKFLARLSVVLVGRVGRSQARICAGVTADVFQMDLGVRCQLAQRLLDLLAGVDTGRVVVAEVIDEGRHGELVDVLGGAVQER